MVADTHSSLDRDEREASIAWLNGLPSNVLILLPYDIAGKLLIYTLERHPELFEGVNAALGEPVESPSPCTLLDSKLEVDFYIEWEYQGLHLVYSLIPQYPFKGGKYYIDFVYVPLEVGIELDGYNYHTDREQFTRDRMRQREIEAEGWRIIRFSSDEVFSDVTKCVQEAAHFLSVAQFQRQGRERY